MEFLTLSHKIMWQFVGTPAQAKNKPTESESIKAAMHAVYGHSLGLASVLVASKYSSLGVPSNLYTKSLSLAKYLILDTITPVPNAHAIVLKAGYCILGALCFSSPEELLESTDDPVDLWGHAFRDSAKTIVLDTKYVFP